MVVEVRLPPAVKPIVEDLPPLMDRHTDRPGLYVGLSNTDPTADFTGGSVLISRDAGVTWEELHSLNGEAIAGRVVGTLAAGASGHFWDTVNVLRILLDRTGYTPANEPDEVVASGRMNLLLVGREILGFATAAAVAGQDRTFDLSRLIRGRRDTFQHIDTHAADEPVTLLSPPSSIQFVETGYNDLGRELKYRAVPFGLTAADSVYQEARTPMAENVLPFAPILLPATRDAAGNITVSWKPRSKHIYRLLGPAKDFRLECCGCEQYEVDILSADRSTVLRTFTVLNRTDFVYTVARQTTDWGSPQPSVQVAVYQAMQMTGRGRTKGGAV